MKSQTGYDYSELDPGYYDHVFHLRHGIQSKWHHLKFREVSRLIDSGQRHLDVGCGPGTFIGTLGVDVVSTGIDIAAPQILYAKQHYATENRDFQLLDGCQFPFNDNLFDVITCIELIEHLDDDQVCSLLEECFRVLKPGGRLILTTPDYEGLWPILEYFVNRVGKIDYRSQHINKFSAERLEAVLLRADFNPKKIGRSLLTAPFAAVFGWVFADYIARIEPAWLVNRFGFLLLAVAEKTRD